MSEIWRCSYQDYRGFRERNPGDRHPTVVTEDFATKAEAEVRKAELKRLGQTVCVTLYTPRPPKAKKDPNTFVDAIKTWRLYQ